MPSYHRSMIVQENTRVLDKETEITFFLRSVPATARYFVRWKINSKVSGPQRLPTPRCYRAASWNLWNLEGGGFGGGKHPTFNQPDPPTLTSCAPTHRYGWECGVLCLPHASMHTCREYCFHLFGFKRRCDLVSQKSPGVGVSSSDAEPNHGSYHSVGTLSYFV